MGKVTPIRPETAGAIVAQLQRVRDNADRRPPDGGGNSSPRMAVTPAGGALTYSLMAPAGHAGHAMH